MSRNGLWPNTEHRIKQGDTMMPLTASLMLGNVPVDLTACTVRFIMRPRFAATPAVPVLNQPADVLDATAGRVRYQWQSGNTAVVGKYAAEFEVTYPSTGRKLTVPNDGYISVVVLDDIA